MGNWLISSPVTKLKLKCFSSEGVRKNLVPEAYAENGFMAYKLLDL